MERTVSFLLSTVAAWHSHCQTLPSHPPVMQKVITHVAVSILDGVEVLHTIAIIRNRPILRTMSHQTKRYGNSLQASAK